MRLFITGATGYVGRNIVAKALLRGHNVVELARIASNARLGLDSAVRQSQPASEGRKTAGTWVQGETEAVSSCAIFFAKKRTRGGRFAAPRRMER